MADGEGRKMNKKSLDNLVTQADRSPEERRAIAKKGQEASVKKRRENNSLRKALQDFLDGDSGVKDRNGEALTGTQLMVSVAIKEMVRGNPRYWEIIRDTAGEKPVEKIMVSEVSQAVIDEVEKAVLEP